MKINVSKIKYFKFKYSESLVHEIPNTHQYNAIKGILITLIAIGHLRHSNFNYQIFQNTLYNFHAPLFLIIAFMFPTSQLSWRKLKTRALRYFVPVTWFSFLAFVLFNLFISSQSFFEALKNYGLAGLTGTAQSFNAATGFEAFWFMHALFGVFVIRAVIARGGVVTPCILFVLCLVSMYLVHSQLAFSRLLPTVFTISAYIVFTSVFVFKTANFLVNNLGFILGVVSSLIMFFGISIYSVISKTYYNIAHLRVPTLFNPVQFGLYILLLGSALAVITFLSRHKVLTIVFSPIGKISFEIYLMHIFIFFAVERLTLFLGLDLSDMFVLFIMLLASGGVTIYIARLSRKLSIVENYVFIR